MAELKTMYPAQANTPETTLAGALTTSDTSVTVLDGSVLPDAPNLLTIGADTTTAETVLMTAKDGNVLTIERGYNGTSPRSWTKGDIVGRYFTAADQTALQENIRALDEGKPDIVPSPVSGNFVAFDGATGAQKDSGKKPDDFAAASHTHDGYIEKPASPVSGNFVAFDGTTGAVKDSGKKPGDFAPASHSHAGYAEVKIFQNVTVAASAWANSSTYRWFANKACPGEYLYSRHGEIAAEVTKRLAAEDKPAEPTAPAGTGDNPSAWAKAATEYCKRKGIFAGDGAGNFDWQKPITREQVAAVLYRTLERAGLLEALPDKK